MISFRQDLIHGAPINKPVANTASVKAVYTEYDESEITFTRKYVTYTLPTHYSQLYNQDTVYSHAVCTFSTVS